MRVYDQGTREDGWRGTREAGHTSRANQPRSAVQLLVRRSCDWPPGGGMPNVAFDKEQKTPSA